MEAKHKDITELIIRAFYTVYNTLGYGFLEKVYQNALIIELRKLGLEVIPEALIKVYYNPSTGSGQAARLLVNTSPISSSPARSWSRSKPSARWPRSTRPSC